MITAPVKVPQVGDRVKPDEWREAQLLMAAEPGDLAPFRLRSGNYSDLSYPVRVELAGKGQVRRIKGVPCVRVTVTFFCNGEPSIQCGGWLVI